ncbi:MAG: hypothetical protein ACTSWN_06770 [Promethearchaeota archaeon]
MNEDLTRTFLSCFLNEKEIDRTLKEAKGIEKQVLDSPIGIRGYFTGWGLIADEKNLYFKMVNLSEREALIEARALALKDITSIHSFTTATIEGDSGPEEKLVFEISTAAERGLLNYPTLIIKLEEGENMLEIEALSVDDLLTVHDGPELKLSWHYGEGGAKKVPIDKDFKAFVIKGADFQAGTGWMFNYKISVCAGDKKRLIQEVNEPHHSDAAISDNVFQQIILIER